MESALENVGRGILDALQRLTDARARLTTHRTILDENRRVLVRAMSPLLLLHPAEATSSVPSCSSCGASDTPLTPLRRGQSANASGAAGSSPSYDALLSLDDRAEDAEDPIIISPAAAARARAPPAPQLLELQLPAPVSSAPALPGTSACAVFYSAMVARTQQIEAQRFHYRHEHAVHTAKLQISQAWVREVQPWFEKAVHRSFFVEVLHRLDALDRRLARLCRRMELDRPQYTPTRCGTLPTRRGAEAPDEVVSEAGHPHHRQLRAQWRPPLIGDGSERRPTDRLGGAHEQACTGGGDGGEREAVQPQPCTEEGSSLSVPPIQQGRASGAAAEVGSAEGSGHSVCSLWCQYICAVSQADTVGDEHLQSCEQSGHTLLPAKSLPVPLLRTPRSLRHVWHVIMEGFTSSGVAVDSGSRAAESVVAPPATDSVSMGDTVPQSGRRPPQLGHNNALLQSLSILVRRCFGLYSAPSGPQPTRPLCGQRALSHETGYHGGCGGAADDERRDATSLVQVRAPSDTGFLTVDLFPSHVCALLCCAMQLCPLAELHNTIRPRQPLHDGAALPRLTYDGGAGVCAEDDSDEDDAAGGAAVVLGGLPEPVALSAGTTDSHPIRQRTREELIAEALAAVYHAVPRLLSQFRRVFQKQRGRRGGDSGALQRGWSEVETMEVDASTRPRPCASSAEEDCTYLMKCTVDAGAATHGAALCATVGDAARDCDAFAQRWLSLSSSLLTTATSPASNTLITDVPPLYARALRVGSLYRSFVDIVADECGERLTPHTGEAAPALASPATPTPLCTAPADGSALVISDFHLAQLSTAAAPRANFIAPASSPLLSASARLSSLRHMELQTRQQWQSTETRLSVARSMAAAALQRAAPGGSEARHLPG
ncbi:hypothetical protein LSCM4_05211 [Leishmania orientalis]|uniref:Uncharacterized protein n=1 Tax=Leishmania orientalis TaxID=2249476 RepID=A0A836G6N8_9TRYP|nr:hypothetical protein LSCM4_05211 [Leishmania orientalis]